MKCMRCGNQTEENQVFCAECLEDMERQPVKPGTPVLLPDRKKSGTTRRSGFQLAASKWQDKIFRLKYIIFWLIVFLVLTGAALAVVICLLLQVTPEWLNELLLGEKEVETWIASLNP